MLGCLRRLGCLVFLLVAAAAAWLLRDTWMPRVFGREVREERVSWERVTPLPSVTQARIEALARPSGAAYATLSAGEAAAFLLETGGTRLPRTLRDVRAHVAGDQLVLEGAVDLTAARGIAGLLPLGGARGWQDMRLAGTLHVVRSGLGEFTVERVSAGDLALPAAAIPALLGQLVRDARPAGVSSGGLPLHLPGYIADIRIARGKVTFYKGTP